MLAIICTFNDHFSVMKKIEITENVMVHKLYGKYYYYEESTLHTNHSMLTLKVIEGQ